MAAPVVVGTPTTHGASTGTVSTLNVPAGAVVGEHLAAVVVSRSAGTITMSSWTGGGTWTKVGQKTVGALTVAFFTIELTGTIPASVAFTCTASGARAALMTRLQGGLAGSLTDVLGEPSAALDSTWDAPSITTTEAALLLGVFLGGNASTAPPINPPPGMTEVGEEKGGTSTGAWVEVAQETVAAGATGTRTATGADTSNGAGLLWSLKGAAGGGSTPATVTVPALALAVALAVPVVTGTGSTPATVTVPALSAPVALEVPEVDVATTLSSAALAVPIALTAPVVTGATPGSTPATVTVPLLAATLGLVAPVVTGEVGAPTTERTVTLVRRLPPAITVRRLP